MKWRLLGTPTNFDDGQVFAAVPEQAFDTLEAEADPRYITYYTGPEVTWETHDPGAREPILVVLRRDKNTRYYELRVWGSDRYFQGTPTIAERRPQNAASKNLKGALVTGLHQLWQDIAPKHEGLREEIREALLVAEARDA